LYSAGAVEKAARVSPGRRQNHCRERRRPSEAGGVVDNARNIVLEVHRVPPNELAAAPHFPDLVENSVGEALASRAASKNHDVTAEKPRAWREVDARFAAQTGAAEQDRLRWRRFEYCPGANRRAR